MSKKKSDIISNLYKIPPREKDKKGETPHYYKTGITGRMQFADLLFLPTDDSKAKYLLVVVDMGTRYTDAEPLKTKDADSVAKAFGKIYKRRILQIPEKIRVDAGSEFKGATLKFLKGKNIIVNVAIVGRHRQMSIVESRNRVIGKELFKKMLATEMLTGIKSTNWVRFLRPLIKLMNKKADKIKVHRDNMKEDYVKLPKKRKEFLKIGQKVRVQLDNPEDYLTGQRLHGRFRATDVRYAAEPRTIKDYQLMPNQPVLYYLNDLKDEDKTDYKVGYTKNQLFVIPDDEKLPDRNVLSAKDKKQQQKTKQYVVEKIIGNKIINGKMLFKTKWLGYALKDSTFEPRKNLPENMVKDYLKSIT